MRRITKQSLDELAATMSIVSMEEQSNSIGGNDCVLQVYSDISGFSVQELVSRVVTGLGYNVYDTNGLYTSDIITAGSFAQLNVTELSSPLTFNNSTGKLPDGSTLMMTYNPGSVGHAVIVTNIDYSTEIVTFRDPQNNNTVDTLNIHQNTGMYSIYH